MAGIGQKIRLLRQQKGWCQEELAQRLKVSTPSVCKIENGMVDIHFSRIEEIATIFNMTVLELFTYELANDPKHRRTIENKLRDREAEVLNLRKQLISLHKELATYHNKVLQELIGAQEYELEAF